MINLCAIFLDFACIIAFFSSHCKLIFVKLCSHVWITQLFENNTIHNCINALCNLICIVLILDIWSIIFSIVNLIARPFSLLILHRELVDRGGSFSTQTVFPAPTQQRSYQDIDRPTQQVPTHNVSPVPPNQHSAGIF